MNKILVEKSKELLDFPIDSVEKRCLTRYSLETLRLQKFCWNICKPMLPVLNLSQYANMAVHKMGVWSRYATIQSKAKRKPHLLETDSVLLSRNQTKSRKPEKPDAWFLKRGVKLYLNRWDASITSL